MESTTRACRMKEEEDRRWRRCSRSRERSCSHCRRRGRSRCSSRCCGRHRKEEAKQTIHVDMFWGPILELQLDLSETIADVKAMICEQEGIHAMQQQLTYGGKRLDDDHRTLADYGVQHGPYSALLLFKKRPPIDDTGAHRMEAMASEGLRRRIQEAKKTIIVKDLLGSIKLELDLSETIAGVKAMIYEKVGIHPKLQRLIFKGREAMDNDHTLEEHGIENGSIIQLVQRISGGGHCSINIFVRNLDGGIFTVQLSSLTRRINEVRDAIHFQEGIPPTQHYLFFCGQRLNDDRTLDEYSIQENSTLHLAPGPSRDDDRRTQTRDADWLVKSLKTGQAADTDAAAVGEGSSHGHDQQSSGSQSQALMAGHHEGRNKQMKASSETEEAPSMVINGTVSPADQFIKKQQIRWSKYSVKAIMFAITMLVTYLGSASTLFSTGNMVFKICIGAFFLADAALSIMMPPKMGSALVYLSWFLLVLVSYLLLVSFNKYYVYAILPVPLPIVAALLQHKWLYGRLTGQQKTNSEGDQNVDKEAPGQAHNNDEDEHNFDCIFDLSATIVTFGGLITMIFGNSMAGPVSAVGFLFFYNVALGLYLMMVTTERTVVLTPHAGYLAILLKVLLVITLITALIHGVPPLKCFNCLN